METKELAKLPETTLADTDELIIEEDVPTADTPNSGDVAAASTSTQEAENSVATPMSNTKEAPSTGADTEAANGEDGVLIGFRNALAELSPNWEAEIPAEDLKLLRHFYVKGIKDMQVFTSSAVQQTIAVSQNLQQGIQTSISTLMQGQVWLLSPDNLQVASVDVVSDLIDGIDNAADIEIVDID